MSRDEQFRMTGGLVVDGEDVGSELLKWQLAVPHNDGGQTTALWSIQSLQDIMWSRFMYPGHPFLPPKAVRTRYRNIYRPPFAAVQAFPDSHRCQS